jgi:hypothetical protein
MKTILSGIAFAFAAICLTSSAANANPSCLTDAAAGMNVLSVGACDLGGLTFSSFSVAPTPGSTVLLSSLGTGGTALGFQITTSYVPGPPVVSADTILQYSVMGQGITGVDNTNAGQTGAIIEEKVCNVAFSNGICTGDGAILLADFTTGGNSSNAATFASQSTIYILKDIQQNGANAFISSFVNSHETSGVPEPASLSMMGIGLLGLGVIGRRKRKV